MELRRYKKPETLAEALKSIERLTELIGDFGRLANQRTAAAEVSLRTGKHTTVRIVATAPFSVSEEVFAEHIAKTLASTWGLLQSAGENFTKESNDPLAVQRREGD